MRILRVPSWINPDTKGDGNYLLHTMTKDQAVMKHVMTVFTTWKTKSLPWIKSFQDRNDSSLRG